jgi:hypothetical protein
MRGCLAVRLENVEIAGAASGSFLEAPSGAVGVIHGGKKSRPALSISL